MIKITIVLFLYVFVAFLTQIILHEIGHLIFGMLTGYRFLAFRVLCITFLKNEGGYKIIRNSCSGSLGQCNMIPPDNERFPFVGIICGGIIMNFLTATISIVLTLFLRELSYVNAIGLMLFSFYGITMAIMSVLPLKKGEIINDGAVLIDLLRDTYARECYKKQMIISSLLTIGKTYSEVPYEVISVKDDADLTNSVIGYHKILECYYFMDQRNWNSAKSSLETFYIVIDNLPFMIRNLVLSEDLFIRLKLGDTTVKQSDIYDGLTKFLKNGTGDFNTYRVFIANELSKSEKTIDEQKIRNDMYRLNNKNMYPGEARFCESLINELL